MKKSVLIILAIFSGLVCGAQFKGGHYSDLDDSETVAAFKEHISYLSAVSLEGRQAGSEGETGEVKGGADLPKVEEAAFRPWIRH